MPYDEGCSHGGATTFSPDGQDHGRRCWIVGGRDYQAGVDSARAVVHTVQRWRSCWLFVDGHLGAGGVGDEGGTEQLAAAPPARARARSSIGPRRRPTSRTDRPRAIRSAAMSRPLLPAARSSSTSLVPRPSLTTLISDAVGTVHLSTIEPVT